MSSKFFKTTLYTKGTWKRPVLVKLSLLFLCFLSLSLSAQLVSERRINIELSGNENDEFNVVSFKEKGVVLLNSKANNFGRNLEVNFIKFDTTLSQIWTNSYEPGFLYRMVKYFENDEYLYVLFREDDKQDINILRLNIVTGDFVVTESKLLTRMEIDLFKVINSKALIGGRYNDRPVVEMVNLFGQTSKVLPEIHANNIKLNNIEVNEEEGLVYVLLKNDRNCKLYLKVFDYEGRLVGDKVLGEKNKLPLNGRLIKIPNGDFVLAGNYADNCSEYSVGFYTHSLSKDEETKYYDFLDLDNFLSYMPDRRQRRVKNRISKKNLKGKDFKLRQRLLIQDPVESPEGMTLMAEVFYPEYKNYITNLNPIGRNYRWGASSYYNYNNFRYTHALILNFDKGGKLLWDNSISLSELESRTLDHKVQFSAVGNKYVLAYPDEGIIKTTILDGTSQTTQEMPLQLATGAEKVVETYQSELSAWYGHSFIAYGIQSLRQKEGLFPIDVFYLSKLTYE